jgi:hypothetical protein
MSAKQAAPKYPLAPANDTKRCLWSDLTVERADGKRVTPVAKRRALEHWAETGGESPKGYLVHLPAGAVVINMDGFWPGDEK